MLTRNGFRASASVLNPLLVVPNLIRGTLSKVVGMNWPRNS